MKIYNYFEEVKNEITYRILSGMDTQNGYTDFEETYLLKSLSCDQKSKEMNFASEIIDFYIDDMELITDGHKEDEGSKAHEKNAKRCLFGNNAILQQAVNEYYMNTSELNIKDILADAIFYDTLCRQYAVQCVAKDVETDLMNVLEDELKNKTKSIYRIDLGGTTQEDGQLNYYFMFDSLKDAENMFDMMYGFIMPTHPEKENCYLYISQEVYADCDTIGKDKPIYKQVIDSIVIDADEQIQKFERTI